MTKSAVLLIIFNRLDTTKLVFEAIRRAKPPRLYLAADGPRAYSNTDGVNCQMARSIINAVDWDCEVKTLFRERNLGCKYAVSGAIDWFFEHEQMGIILEDDVLPTDQFFEFCDAMLIRYEFEESVMMIGGVNHYPTPDSQLSYFFSEHFVIWGWATWRRAWKKYSVEIEEISPQHLNFNFLKDKLNNWRSLLHFVDSLNKVSRGEINTWDYQWSYACLINSGMCIVPKVNLISNIGVHGTHANSVTNSHFMQTGILDVPYSHNYYLTVNKDYDSCLYRNKIYKRTLFLLIKKCLSIIGLWGAAKYIKNIFYGVCR